MGGDARRLERRHQLFRPLQAHRLEAPRSTNSLSEGADARHGRLVVLFALAIPALREFDEGKFLTGQYAVKFLDQNGNEIGKRGILHNDAVPLEEIPDSLIKATLATEDRRFFEHYGIDVIGTGARPLHQPAGQRGRPGRLLPHPAGGQEPLPVVRALHAAQDQGGCSSRSCSRAASSKREILKLYFDRAYMGGGAFGVEAASQYYFGKSVREINLAEVGAARRSVQGADQVCARTSTCRASRARTNDVLNNLVEAGFYTSGQVHDARLNPAKIVETRNPNSPDWFLDWAFEEVQRLAEGSGQYVLTARTTIDLTCRKPTDDAI